MKKVHYLNCTKEQFNDYLNEEIQKYLTTFYRFKLKIKDYTFRIYPMLRFDIRNATLIVCSGKIIEVSTGIKVQYSYKLTLLLKLILTTTIVGIALSIIQKGRNYIFLLINHWPLLTIVTSILLIICVSKRYACQKLLDYVFKEIEQEIE